MRTKILYRFDATGETAKQHASPFNLKTTIFARGDLVLAGNVYKLKFGLFAH
jgi:hypothetical protein